nr:bacterial DNA-binding family protein [Agrobacterium tumefaciens]
MRGFLPFCPFLRHIFIVKAERPKTERGLSDMTTTNEIADKIAAEQSLTKAQAKTIVESVFKQITDAALAGAETSIPSFGKFKLKDTPEREGRNPATGATIKIAASKKLTFTPGKAVKDALNG